MKKTLLLLMAVVMSGCGDIVPIKGTLTNIKNMDESYEVVLFRRSGMEERGKLKFRIGDDVVCGGDMEYSEQFKSFDGLAKCGNGVVFNFNRTGMVSDSQDNQYKLSGVDYAWDRMGMTSVNSSI